MSCFRDLLKKYQYSLTEPDLDRSANIRFIHQKPKFGNIGDDLCSLKHYFNFKAKNRINIFGGGVEDQFYLKKINQLDLDISKSILWAVGQSIKNPPQPHFISTLTFPFWGLRDIDSVEHAHFLPCVSCLHPMLDLPQTNSNKFIFLNFDKKVTDKQGQKLIQDKFPEYHFLYNNCSIDTFIETFQKTSHIITNSFHGTYWGLLAGKTVTLIGYSSKFNSLYKMFNLDPKNILQVSRRNCAELLNAIEIASTGVYDQQLQDSIIFKRKFRELNMNFVTQLQASGLFDSIELKNGTRNAQ